MERSSNPASMKLLESASDSLHHMWLFYFYSNTMMSFKSAFKDIASFLQQEDDKMCERINVIIFTHKIARLRVWLFSFDLRDIDIYKRGIRDCSRDFGFEMRPEANCGILSTSSVCHSSARFKNLTEFALMQAKHNMKFKKFKSQLT